jgi:hypothetical protein
MLISDQSWYDQCGCGAQLTLTTRLAGGKGYEFYVDGNLVGETQANMTYIGARRLYHCHMSRTGSATRNLRAQIA